MALFNRNPNEDAYIGGKKHWTDVIKNSGPGDLLIWRQPEEDFNTNSTLIVMPGEEALFIKGGTIEQVFDNGTYKLSTDNYPFISRLRNAFSGGVSTFNCVVYFVRKAHSMEIYWGTDSPIQVRDPVMQIATSAQARGSYKVQIDDPGKFLTKMLGNNVPFLTQSELSNYFINEFQQHIKSSLARAIRNSNQEIMGICAEQTALAAQIQPVLQGILGDYGLKLIAFTIAAIDIPDNDPNRQKLEEAFANKGVMGILGDNWGRQQSTEILHTLAANPGAGGGAAVGVGVGVGMSAGSVFASMAQQMFAPMSPQPPVQQPVQAAPSGRFVQRGAANCSSPAAQGFKNPVESLKELKALLDQGLIPQEEFDSKMHEILERM